MNYISSNNDKNNNTDFGIKIFDINIFSSRYMVNKSQSHIKIWNDTLSPQLFHFLEIAQYSTSQFQALYQFHRTNLLGHVLEFLYQEFYDRRSLFFLFGKSL